MIKLIVAHDINGGIGKDNKLVWNLPSDMKHFRETTKGHIVVMGRKTYESIGGALKGRLNIVLSKTLPLVQEGDVLVFRHFGTVLETALKARGDVFIIGGSSIYEQFLPYADEVIVTEIQKEFECDSFFPNMSQAEWKLVEWSVVHEENNIPYKFLKFERRM